MSPAHAWTRRSPGPAVCRERSPSTPRAASPRRRGTRQPPPAPPIPRSAERRRRGRARRDTAGRAVPNSSVSLPPTRRLRHTELVALRVLHHHPVRAELLDVAQPGGAERLHALDAGVDRRPLLLDRDARPVAHAHVEVQPVLPLLRLRDA